ncbi:heat-inducible transcriptional repressor HrcA [Salimicrobium halophilum]|uniref:Heat-inducible transcription repressor HrcA n=1 Tax=Salimicrobium halophilum TaxID=86666 RepID=A0A1G8PR87_9BACI|nr:heat-inducible transcriptional repressor HrcA [Salimicrobium halophilum]SDI94380.1 heat-inducible transcription repressor HrcA [Salimicrobium halophilum]
MLTNRQLQILKVIIDDFILTAQPVGSRYISKKESVDFSPATIRNEMADLEDMGFLEKTHSSSGRVPSEKGYRFYVDHLLSPSELSSKEKTIFEETFGKRVLEFEQVVEKSAGILSELTSYTSIILGPEVFENKLKQLQITPLTEEAAVAVLVTNTGHVEHRVFSVPVEIKPSDLEKMVNILNDRLQGIALIELPNRLNEEIFSLLREHAEHYNDAIKYLRSALVNDRPAKLYVGGKTNMLMQPEFRDIDKIRSIMSMIEDERDIAKLLKTNDRGIQTMIGHENPFNALQNCSIITANYYLGNQQVGTVALLGPTRMEYNRVVALVEELSKHMTKTFKEWY